MKSFSKRGLSFLPFLNKRLPVHTLFVFFTGLLLAIYIAAAATGLQFTIPLFLVTAAIVSVTLTIIWILSSLSLASTRSLTLDQSLRISSFPFISFWLLAVFIGEFLFGKPSLTRSIGILVVCIGLFSLFQLSIRVRNVKTLFDWSECKSQHFIVLLIGAYAIIFTALIVMRHCWFGSVLGEDTGYYSQILWNTLNGKFFYGTLTQARYFDPPVYSEFAVHNSPVLFLILPVYWMFPSFYTILVLRNLALAASAIPLYLLAKEKVSPLGGVFIAIAYLFSTNILYQSLNGFYPLQFAALFLSFTFYYFFKERLSLFILFLLLSLSVREEIALTSILFGLYALALKRRWFWIVIPTGLSIIWWYISTELIMVRSQIVMEDLDQFYQFFGGGHNQALKVFVSEPWKVLGILLEKDNGSYLYELVKPAAMMPFLSVAVLFAMPTVIINSVIGAFMSAMRDVSYHYSIVASICLFNALIYGVASAGRFGRFFAVGRSQFLTAIAFLLVPIAFLGLADVIRYGGGRDGVLVDDFVRKPYHTTLKEIVGLIEPEAAVAAPNFLLPQLSYREKLYTSNRLWRYPAITADYIIMDTKLEKLSIADRNKAKYRESLAQVQNSPGYKMIYERDGFQVYKITDAGELQSNGNQ
jgi:uncharacterized membrane protein